MIAGAAALVLQANPSLKPDSVIALFHLVGDRITSPDNNYGWGIPNVKSIVSLVKSHGTSIAKSFVVPNPVTGTWLDFYMDKNEAYLSTGYRIYNILGQLISRGTVDPRAANRVRIRNPFDISSGIYFIQIQTSLDVFTAKFLFLNK